MEGVEGTVLEFRIAHATTLTDRAACNAAESADHPVEGPGQRRRTRRDTANYSCGQRNHLHPRS
jgi:hypothetical protein